MQEVRSPVRENSEVFRQNGQEVPRLRGTSRANDLRSGSAVQRLGLVRDRLRQEALFPGILRQRRLSLEGFFLERQEGRQIQVGWLLVAPGQFRKGNLIERELVQRHLFQGKSAQRFRTP